MRSRNKHPKTPEQEDAEDRERHAQRKEEDRAQVVTKGVLMDAIEAALQQTGGNVEHVDPRELLQKLMDELAWRL